MIIIQVLLRVMQEERTLLSIQKDDKEEENETGENVNSNTEQKWSKPSKMVDKMMHFLSM
jgi:hypothetical protein